MSQNQPGEKNEKKFIDDYYLKGMLYCLTIRSTISRGIIKSIEIPETASLDITVFSAHDIPGSNKLKVFHREMPLLAEEEVKYQGEPILLLCGHDEKDLLDMKNQIKISYFEQEPILNPEKAPKSHQMGIREIWKGQTSKGFEKAVKTIENSYATGSQQHFFSDPQGAVAVPEDGRILVYSSTQWPEHVRTTVAEATGMAKKQIEVRTPLIGNPLDTKILYPSLLAAQAACVALKTQQPVRLILSREEETDVAPKRAPVVFHYKSGLDREGNLLALDITLQLDAGAYPLFSDEILDRLVIGVAGVYECPHIHVKGYIIRTNKPPQGAFAGFGLSQAFFALETHIEQIIGLSQSTPYIWLKRNLFKSGSAFITGGILKNIPLPQLMDSVVEESDFIRKYSAYETLKKNRTPGQDPYATRRGIGLSVCYHGNDFIAGRTVASSFNIKLKINTNGELYIYTPGISYSKGVIRIWKKIAQDILHIDPEKIHVMEAHASVVNNSAPTTISRNITIASNLIEKASHALAKKRFRSPLPLEVKKSFKPPKSAAWDFLNFKGMPFPFLSWGAAVVELEFNPISFEIKVRQIWTALDLGKIILPGKAGDSVESAIFQALDWCHTDYAAISSKSVRASLPHPIKEIPPITINFLKTAKKFPQGGMIEIPFSTIPAAYAAAFSQATGNFINKIPILTENIMFHSEES